MSSSSDGDSSSDSSQPDHGSSGSSGTESGSSGSGSPASESGSSGSSDSGSSGSGSSGSGSSGSGSSGSDSSDSGSSGSGAGKQKPTSKSKSKKKAKSKKKPAALGLRQVLTKSDDWPSGMDLWGLDILDGYRDGHYAFDYSGLGVNVYVLSSGVRTGNSEYEARVKALWEAPNIDNSAYDCHGVGSHFAGIVAGSTAGVAKNATVHMLRVAGCETLATESLVMNSVRALEFLETAVVSPAVLALALPLTKEPPSNSERNMLAAALKNFLRRVQIPIVVPVDSDLLLTTCSMLSAITSESADASLVNTGALATGLELYAPSTVDAATCINFVAPGERIWVRTFL